MKNKVKILRESCNLTQKELGEITNVSRQAINAIETGKYAPSIMFFVQLFLQKIRALHSGYLQNYSDEFFWTHC